MAELAILGGKVAAEGLRVPPWPQVTDDDRRAVSEALESRRWCRLWESSRVAEFERRFASLHDARHGIAAVNGTAALELALLACGVRPGDEVLVPAVTFIASASAITRTGAIPVFVDSSPESPCMDPEDLVKRITPRTRGMVVVHYGGYPADLDRILPAARERGLFMVEDCAHAQGSSWRGTKVGALGDMGAFSFQESKSVSSGEGGIVLTNDEALAERARLIHNIGRAVGAPGYRHLVLASNYRMSELHGALLNAQLQRFPEQQLKREQGGVFLSGSLREIGGLEPLPADSRITSRGYYFFVVRYDSRRFRGVHRDVFVRALQAEGVPSSIAYAMPLYRQPCFAPEAVRPLYAEGAALPAYHELRLPRAERFCYEEQVVLPHAVLLAERGELQRVVDACAKILANPEELAKASEG